MAYDPSERNERIGDYLAGRNTPFGMMAFPDYGDRISPMTMSEPELNPAPPKEATVEPYDPMLAAREWGSAIADPRIPGSLRWIEEKDAYGRKKNIMLRLALLGEEHKELVDELLDVAAGRGDRAKAAKELADNLYVLYGIADDLEIPLPRVFDAVHLSNMTKVGVDGKVERRRDGKILKGPDYLEPDIESVILPGLAS